MSAVLHVAFVSGRRPPCLLPYPVVSPHPTHQIECRDGKVYFEDLGSTNGSFLNGTPLEERAPQPLQTGDLLKIGATKMVVELQAQPGAQGDSQ